MNPISDEERAMRDELTRIAHLVYQKGYNASIDGNLSCRLKNGEILLTPSGKHNGFITAEDIIVIDIDGKLIRGERKPSSEYRLHREIYKARDDIDAVIHSHSPYAIAASLAGIDMMDMFVTMAPVPTTEYAQPSSSESPQRLRPWIENYNWGVLKLHGAVTWAETPWDAFLRLEGLEHLAKILLVAKAAGPIKPMDRDKKRALLKFWNLEQIEEDMPHDQA